MGCAGLQGVLVGAPTMGVLMKGAVKFLAQEAFIPTFVPDKGWNEHLLS